MSHELPVQPINIPEKKKSKKKNKTKIKEREHFHLLEHYKQNMRVAIAKTTIFPAHPSSFRLLQNAELTILILPCFLARILKIPQTPNPFIRQFFRIDINLHNLLLFPPFQIRKWGLFHGI